MASVSQECTSTLESNNARQVVTRQRAALAAGINIRHTTESHVTTCGMPIKLQTYRSYSHTTNPLHAVAVVLCVRPESAPSCNLDSTIVDASGCPTLEPVPTEPVVRAVASRLHAVVEGRVARVLALRAITIAPVVGVAARVEPQLGDEAAELAWPAAVGGPDHAVAHRSLAVGAASGGITLLEGQRVALNEVSLVEDKGLQWSARGWARSSLRRWLGRQREPQAHRGRAGEQRPRLR